MKRERRDARIHLMETLDHWRDGTRPGDDGVTRADVVMAIERLIEAIAADKAKGDK